MENQLWNLFRETGDPMCYLLYKAEVGSGAPDKSKEQPKPPGGPTASA